MQENTHFSVADVLKNLLALLMFVVLTSWAIRAVLLRPRADAWIAIALFGTMSVLTVINIIRISGLDEQLVTGPEAKHRTIRRALMHVGTAIVTLFLGVADQFIAEFLAPSFPPAGTWLGTFLTTLAFYPLRDKEDSELKFREWALYCVLMGWVSVALSYLSDWLRSYF